MITLVTDHGTYTVSTADLSKVLPAAGEAALRPSMVQYVAKAYGWTVQDTSDLDAATLAVMYAFKAA